MAGLELDVHMASSLRLAGASPQGTAATSLALDLCPDRSAIHRRFSVNREIMRRGARYRPFEMSYSHSPRSFYRYIRFILELGGAIGIAFTYLYVVGQNQYDAFAKAIVPILATYVATAALLYNRARGLPNGKNKLRSLYAAERAVQAIIFSITGVLIGAIIYACLSSFRIVIDEGRDFEDPWVLVYIPSVAFVVFGYVSFLFALRTISRDFLRPISAREIARRIRKSP
jgi:hypothetical protein